MRASRDWYPPVADTQYGTFTRAQALEAHATPREIYQRIRTGQWVRTVGRGFRDKRCRETPQSLATAVHLTWPEAVVCGPLAAAMNGAPVSLDGELPVWVPECRRRTHRLIPRRYGLDCAEVVRWGPVLITRRQESLIEALGWLPYGEARDLLAWAVTHRRLDLDTLQRSMVTRSPRWGTGQLRRLLRDSAGGALSEAERRLHQLLRASGMTGWRANVTVFAVGYTYSVDVLFSEARLVIEVDGRRAHGPGRWQRDMNRRNRLERAGYRVVNFSWDDITRRPSEVLATVRDLVGHPSPER